MILLQVLQYTKASKHHQIVIFFKYTEIAMILITGFVLGSHIGVSVVYALLKMGDITTLELMEHPVHLPVCNKNHA